MNYRVIAFTLVALGWFIFGAVFIILLRRKPAQAEAAPERTRDVRSRAGIILQMLGYALVWTLPRQFRPLITFSPALDVALMCLAVLLSAVSIWLGAWAVRTLGKEWSLTARLVEGHRLVREGPYALVRHPIYTGMAGKLLATGLTYSHWLGLLLGVIVFTIGTVIRVRSEERLLRAEFGAEFDAYARRVPAVVPWLF
jgi:protein-S-isoprenylcysteine O-methyltransferase Ste14